MGMDALSERQLPCRQNTLAGHENEKNKVVVCASAHWRPCLPLHQLPQATPWEKGGANDLDNIMLCQ